MERKSKRTMVVLLLLLIMFSATFQECFSDSIQPPSKRRSTQSTPGRRFGSTTVFPLTGNVYPLGYYSVSLKIGNPPKIYELDIDTGSDLTWVQCDAPCKGCTKPRDSLYKPSNNLVLCKDTLCSAVDSPAIVHCENPNDQCDYEVEYADKGSCLGVLVTDYFPMRFTNGTVLGPRLAFGCGYDIHNPGPNPPSPTAGVLGLGNGKASVISQLNALGLTRNVLGHCLSGQSGGFLFMGDDLVPSSGIVWTPMSHNSLEKYYSSGPAELLYGGKATGLKGLQVIFDSGSSYTYFNSQAYKTTVDTLKKNLKGKPLKETRDDQTLPICWKGPKPVKTVRDVKDYFKSLQLSFTKNVQLDLSPEAYLIVTNHGNVCLGILNGTEVGLKDFNILGDISMQDKMVIYDNEKQQIGWIPSNCNRLPKS
ncbi:aspartic proteinase Asp1-like isoform X2 [Mangifera indica]|uniref:aspartic proteinase Asp1-like isoform X2 n=1 Tax=Mangifera indica TaxID=29780 RepID=UPI001CF9E096|nr:aspartic proteinase Asp1-like isoform X2 [Mangifera indica]